MCVYEKIMNMLLHQASDGPASRQASLPDSLREIFNASTAERSNQFYFRSHAVQAANGGSQIISTEFTGMTVIVDEDYNPMGFVELATNTATWVNELATVVNSEGALLDLSSNVFIYSTKTDLFTQIEKNLPAGALAGTSLVRFVDSKHYHSSLLSVNDSTGRPIAKLFLTRDFTSEVLAQRPKP